MAPPGVSVPLRFLREFQKGVSNIRNSIQSSIARNATSTTENLQLAVVRAHKTSSSGIKAAKRWYTTANRALLHNAAINSNPSSQAAGRIMGAVPKIAKTTPFAASLRPKLTGGAFPRTASGYSFGNGGAAGARFFSHGSASPAEVIQQVGQVFRALATSGKDCVADYQKYKNRNHASVLAYLSARSGGVPGAYIDFHMPFHVSRLDTHSFGFSCTLDTEALKCGITVMNELMKLATLGDLPVTFRADTIRVHFAGCDKEAVERLCEHVGVIRGIVGEKEMFGARLLIPAPDMSVSPGFASTPLTSDGSLTSDVRYAVPPADILIETDLDWRGMMSMSGSELTEEGTHYTPAASLLGSFSSGSESALSFEHLSSQGSVWLCSPRELASDENIGLDYTENLPSGGNVWLGTPEQSSPESSAGSLTPHSEDAGLDTAGLQRFLAECEAYGRGETQVWG